MSEHFWKNKGSPSTRGLEDSSETELKGAGVFQSRGFSEKPTFSEEFKLCLKSSM